MYVGATMKRIFFTVVLIGAILFGVKHGKFGHSKTSSKQNASSTYNLPASGSQLSGSGEVIRILSDDNKGSRHQRFILKLPSGQTILIAHNIDLAPRVPGLQVGDTISFSGIYERNPKGGVVHWTHHDPKGHHTAGWLKKQGRIYQ